MGWLYACASGSMDGARLGRNNDSVCSAVDIGVCDCLAVRAVMRRLSGHIRHIGLIGVISWFGLTAWSMRTAASITTALSNSYGDCGLWRTDGIAMRTFTWAWPSMVTWITWMRGILWRRSWCDFVAGSRRPEGGRQPCAVVSVAIIRDDSSRAGYKSGFCYGVRLCNRRIWTSWTTWTSSTTS